MSQNKTFFGRLLADIWGLLGGIFKHVIEGAKETFNKLPQETKDALIHGSGLMALLNSMLDKTPEEIMEAIEEEFPDLDIEMVETGLFEIAHTFNLAPKVSDLDDCIALLTTYLSTIKDTKWDAAMHTGASILGIILAPKGTKFGAIVSLMEYVYRKFFKK